MEFGIAIIIACIILYVLLVKGVLWKIIVGIGAFFGIHTFLLNAIPITSATCITVGGSTFSWAAAIAVFIIFMASLYTRE